MKDEETYYVLTLTAEELACIYAMSGILIGGGPVRKLMNKIFYAIGKELKGNPRVCTGSWETYKLPGESIQKDYLKEFKGLL